MMIEEENQVSNTHDAVTAPSEGDSGQEETPTNTPPPDVGPTLDQLEIPDALLDEVAAAAEPGAEGDGADADPSTLLAAQNEELESLKAQLEEFKGQYARMAADFENFRKRTQREREETEQKAKCSTINELLPVVDNFERARSLLKPQTDEETAIHKSYQGVYKQLVECLKRIGVSPMRAQGTEFDPTLHEAVMREPSDKYPEGVVIEELQRGYMLGDRVLRHALVKVAAPPEAVIASEESGSE
jgi:molecular chaperone GrpE